jgi:hypothetical protein
MDVSKQDDGDSTLLGTIRDAWQRLVADEPSKDLRDAMAWLFLFQFLARLKDSVWAVLSAIHPEYAPLASPGWLTEASLFAFFAAIDGAACWAIWRKKPSARAWGINASGVFIVMFFWRFVFPTRLGWHIWQFAPPTRADWPVQVFYLLAGIVGLVAFIRRDDSRTA